MTISAVYPKNIFACYVGQMYLANGYISRQTMGKWKKMGLLYKVIMGLVTLYKTRLLDGFDIDNKNLSRYT